MLSTNMYKFKLNFDKKGFIVDKPHIFQPIFYKKNDTKRLTFTMHISLSFIMNS